MKTTSITPADIAGSVLSVPPLARSRDGAIAEGENRRLVEWMAGGGVTTFLYGGNANLYNLGLGEFGTLLDMLEAIAPADGWMIPSIGADFGKALDQAAELRGRNFPTAMVLPLGFPATPAGVATGLRRIADAFGRPIVAYMKSEGYADPADIARLMADGVVTVLKYAVVRSDPGEDALLSAILDAAGSGERIVSGIGERPAIVHLTRFGLQGFTSGSVCIAPHLSTALLQALKAGDGERAATLRERFLALEDLRDAHSPIRVLHAAVRLAGIADTGPIGPFLSDLTDEAVLAAIARAARALRDESAASGYRLAGE